MTKILIHPLNQLHFFDPLHCFRRKLWTSTYLGLESYLPASKGCWRRELVKMEIRNLQTLLVCSIIFLVSSTEDDWIFGWRSRLASQILILFWSFTFLRCRHVNWFFNSFPPSRIQFLRIRSWWRSLWMCKNVSWYSRCISNAWRPFLAARRYERMPQHPFRYRMCREWHWLTGNVRISTAYRFSALEFLRIVHTIYFIL